MPYETIPNVSRFAITDLAPYHPILNENNGEEKAILVRTDKPSFKYKNHKNGEINKYLSYMFTCLNKQRSNGKKF